MSGSESHLDELVYEMIPSSTLTGESHTLHFVLADGRFKDNRIPPRGFRINVAFGRISEPAWQGNSAPGHFTDEEYAGGFDQVTIPFPSESTEIDIRLFYQVTSREYIEFLRNEINETVTTFPGNGVAGDPPYLAQTDTFFDQLRVWGDAI